MQWWECWWYWLRQKKSKRWQCQSELQVLNELLPNWVIIQSRGAFSRWDPPFTSLLTAPTSWWWWVGGWGGALVSPRRFIPQPIIMSNKWVSAGSDMLANTNYAQRERLQLGHILKNLYSIFPWRSAPFAFHLVPWRLITRLFSLDWSDETPSVHLCLCVYLWLGYVGFDHII